MSTVMIYNGVQLLDVQTLVFDETAQYDESDTDLLYHDFRIRVMGLAHTTSLAGSGHVIVPWGAPPTAANAVEQIHGQLMHPRADFLYAINGETVLQATSNPNSGDLDVRSGPRPISCSITHVAGSKVIRIEYEIQVCVLKCGSEWSDGEYSQTGRPVQNVLNNKWSLEDTRDENFYVTRTWEGVLRVSHASKFPNAYRNVVIPPLRDGYKRTFNRFRSTPDGLNLRYSITDKQVHAAPPSPAKSWKASHTEGIAAGGGKGHAEVHVTLTGAPETNKRDLIVKCAQVVEARLGDMRKSFGADSENGQLLQSASLVEELDTNRVSMHVRVMRVPNQETYLNLLKKDLGEFLDQGPKPIPNYNHTKSPFPPTFDDETKPSVMFATYLQSPCHSEHGVPQIKELELESPGDKYNKRKVPVEISGEDEKFDSGHGLSQAHQNNMYTYVEVSSEYMTHRGVYQMPISAYSGTRQEDADTSAFVQAHEPITKRVYKVIAERVGEWPDVAGPVESRTDPNGITERLLDDTIHLSDPELASDGRSLLYHIELAYTYGLSRTPTLAETLKSGTSPMLSRKPWENYFLGYEHYNTEAE